MPKYLTALTEYLTNTEVLILDGQKAIANKVGKKLIKDINLFDIYESEEQLGEGKKSYAVSFIFEDPNKTMKDKEVGRATENR